MVVNKSVPVGVSAVGAPVDALGKSYGITISPPARRERYPGQVIEKRIAQQAFGMPKPLTRAPIEDHSQLPMPTTRAVVRDLGLSLAQERGWMGTIQGLSRETGSEVRFRQSMVREMMDRGVDPAMRRPLLDRSLSYFRDERMRKSMGEFQYIIHLDEAPPEVEELRKGARGGTYHRRVAKPESEGGGYRYYYDSESYGKRDDAHVSGQEASADYLHNKVRQFMEKAGKEGCPKEQFTGLAKRFGATAVAQSLMRACPSGVTEKAGRYFAKSSELWVEPDELLIKGRGLPVGSVRQWGDTKYEKKPNGEWVPISGGKRDPHPEGQPRPKRKSPEYAAMAWREEPLPGHLPAQMKGDQGSRGGTEEMHWDKAGGGYTPKRKQLHDQIVAKALAGKTPSPDGERVAIVMMGGTASGKSTMLRQSGEGGDNFVHVDADDIKESLPEYQQALAVKYRGAAGLAHEESSSLAKRVAREAIDKGHDVVLDGTGANAKKFEKQIKDLQEKGYHIKLMMPDQDPEKAMADAVTRAEKTGRWVPVHFIESAYGSIPHNFKKMAALADEASLYDRRQPVGGASKKVWEKAADGTETAHDEAFWAGYPEAQHGGP
jgi:predicted ABC-type ATPase